MGQLPTLQFTHDESDSLMTTEVEDDGGHMSVLR